MFFILTPNLGEDDFHFDEHIFSNGLVQPPTRLGDFMVHVSQGFGNSTFLNWKIRVSYVPWGLGAPRPLEDEPYVSPVAFSYVLNVYVQGVILNGNPFGRNQTQHTSMVIFVGFPLQQSIVWVGNVMTPDVCGFGWLFETWFFLSPTRGNDPIRLILNKVETTN